MKLSDTYDLVVVGAGCAGMAAALVASLDGLRPLVIEHTEYVGGTTALSAGSVWIPNTRHAAEGDSVERAATYLNAVIGTHVVPALLETFLREGPKALELLESQSRVSLRPYPHHPDYEADRPGATLRGRTMEPVPFDARVLGARFAELRPPIPEFTILGGMMVNRADITMLLAATRSFAAMRYSLGLVLRYAMDRLRYPRGTRLVMGNALAAQLFASLVDRGVPIARRARLTRFVRTGARIAGVTLEHEGAARTVMARGGVILASGGFTHHAEMRAQLIPALESHSPASPGNTGRALELALQAGGRLGTNAADAAFWSPVSIRKRADGTHAVFPHFVFDRARPGTVVVNAAGERFLNEAVSYHRFGRAMFAAGAVPAFLIADARALAAYGLGMIRPGGRGLAPYLKDGYLVRADSIRALAAALSIDPGRLERTIARMNEHAASGVDPDFARGSTDYQRNLGDPAIGPNPNLGPIAAPPFYALRLYPGDIGASTGLVTDVDARVLDANDAPIDGLYAAGNDMNSVMAGSYPGPGINLGPAITFGYVAARHIATRCRAP